MKRSVVLKGFVAALCILVYSACSGDDEVIPQPEPTYSVVEVTYVLEEAGDSIMTTAYTFPLHSVTNKTPLPVTVGSKDAFVEPNLTSAFYFSPALPEWMYADTINVPTPLDIFDNKVLLVERGYNLTSGELPVRYNTPDIFELPPNSTMSITFSAKEEILQTTVEIITENDLTGERSSYKGKWRGTIGFTHPTKTVDIKNLE